MLKRHSRKHLTFFEVRRKTGLALLIVLLGSMTVTAEEVAPLQKGDRDFGIWTAGGSDVGGGEDVRLWLLGGRYGTVLTARHGIGFLSGNLEYVLEVIPAFVTVQDATVYGFDVTPLLLKWNFTSSRRIIPYFEAGAGILFTADDVPENASPFNFTPQAGFGLHVLTSEKKGFTFVFKYVHISNGGLASPNPGINSLQMHVGYNWFR